MSLVSIDRKLARTVDALHFAPPVHHVYNPLVYARGPHEKYLSRFGRGPKEVVLLGMNPGPFGMAQTGVPFGDVSMVRDWLGIDGKVGKPPKEHPKRLVTGFACPRSEVSGTRLWGWAKERFVTPEAFFARFFIVNYCPLVFLEEGGRNRTPDKLPVAERNPLTAACDAAVRATIELLSPERVIGVGVYARDAAKRALDGMDIEIGCVLHPSPASPKANRGWAEQADVELREAGVAI
jgi:single-strand selective monofunctional uracil DNA glycosylase